jgi:hypothetical protein
MNSNVIIIIPRSKTKNGMSVSKSVAVKPIDDTERKSGRTHLRQK